MRAINIKPNRGWHVRARRAALLSLLVVAYSIGSDMRLADNPNDKLLPGFGAMSEALKHTPSRPTRAPGIYLLWSDTVASLDAASVGAGDLDGRSRCVFGIVDRPAADLARSMLGPFVAVCLDGAAAGAAADPVHRHGPRRSLEDRADRHRHDAEAHPRPGAARRGNPARADHQGADARRLDLADRARAS